MFWKPAVAVQADVASFLVELSASPDGLKWDPDWVSTLQKRDKDKEIATEKVLRYNTTVKLPRVLINLYRWRPRRPKPI